MSTTGIETQIDALGSGVLTDLVRQATGRHTAELVSWGCRPAGAPTGQATTGGVYRVEGIARDQGEEVGWSLILKVISPPAISLPYYKDVDHPLYWKREVLANQSGVLDDLPGGLQAARCYAIVEQPDESAWLWMEDLRDEYGTQWPLSQYAEAARRLGMFNGAYLAGRPMPSYPWLVQTGSPGGLLEHNTWMREMIADPRTWEHPLVSAAFPASVAGRLLQLWSDMKKLLSLFERLPQTFCHLDAARWNMIAVDDGEGGHRLVVIDWSYLGKGTVATDAGHLFAPSFGLFGVEPIEPKEMDSVIFESYLEGLREVGWHGDRQLVRFAFATYAALQYGCFLPWLADAQDEARHGFWERLVGRPMGEFLQQQATLVCYLLDLADEARGLLPLVEGVTDRL